MNKFVEHMDSHHTKIIEPFYWDKITIAAKAFLQQLLSHFLKIVVILQLWCVNTIKTFKQGITVFRNNKYKIIGATD